MKGIKFDLNPIDKEPLWIKGRVCFVNPENGNRYYPDTMEVYDSSGHLIGSYEMHADLADDSVSIKLKIIYNE